MFCNIKGEIKDIKSVFFFAWNRTINDNILRKCSLWAPLRYLLVWNSFPLYPYDELCIQPQVIKFTSCLPMVGGSLRVLPDSSTTNTGGHDIAEIKSSIEMCI